MNAKMNPTTQYQSLHTYSPQSVAFKLNSSSKAEMRYAAAETPLTVKPVPSGSRILTPHRSPPTSSWYVASSNSPAVAATQSRVDDPARCSRGWIRVGATLSVSRRTGSSERIPEYATSSSF